VKGSIRRITVEGLNLERFIRLAGEQGIPFSKMDRRGRKLLAFVSETDAARLEAIAEQGGWNCWIGRRYGLGRLIDTTKAKLVLIGSAVVCVFLTFAASQTAWSVSIVDAGMYHEDAAFFLAEEGIAVPCRKSSVNLADLRAKLEWRYPDVAWIDCGWRGNTLRISFVQGTPEGDTFTHLGNGDVTAARGGIVEEIITIAGTAAVSPGDLIREGDVLIQGMEKGKEGELHPVRARGIVMARVWDSASVRISLLQTETEYTGREQQVWNVEGPFFRLWPASESPYGQQDVSRKNIPLGGIFLPFRLIVETRMEAEVVNVKRSIDEARSEAGEAAIQILKKKTGFHDDFVDKWVDYCMIENEVIEAVAYAERLVDVAVPASTDE